MGARYSLRQKHAKTSAAWDCHKDKLEAGQDWTLHLLSLGPMDSFQPVLMNLPPRIRIAITGLQAGIPLPGLTAACNCGQMAGWRASTPSEWPFQPLPTPKPAACFPIPPSHGILLFPHSIGHNLSLRKWYLFCTIMKIAQCHIMVFWKHRQMDGDAGFPCTFSPPTL